MNKQQIWDALAAPFPAEDIEWRIAQKGARDGKPWAKVLAYVTNRAIMQRLDDVMGPENWKNEFQHIDSAFLCGLSLRINNEWITKFDGAQESQIEATKGGISGAMKRAAVQWRIGRYLYDLTEGWANIHANGKNYVGADARNNVPAFKWDAPQLPAWALPSGTKQKPEPHRDSNKEKTGKAIKAKLDGAQSPESVDEIMKTYQTAIVCMPKNWQDKLNAIAEARRVELGGEVVNQ